MICMLKVIHYFQLIFSKILEKNAKFPSTHGLAWQAAFYKKQEKK